VNADVTKKLLGKRVPIHWQEDVRFESLIIRYVGLQPGTSPLPQPSGEKFEKPLRLKLPGGFQ